VDAFVYEDGTLESSPALTPSASGAGEGAECRGVARNLFWGYKFFGGYKTVE